MGPGRSGWTESGCGWTRSPWTRRRAEPGSLRPGPAILSSCPVAGLAPSWCPESRELLGRRCAVRLYIFEISCLSVASFPIIFSHSEGCLFTLLIVCFDVQKLLRLIRSHLFIFVFISNILGGGS